MSQTGTRLRVALVMPALNEEATVRSALQAVRDSTRQPDEIVVVDGGSTDGTQAMLQQAQAGLPVHLLVRPGHLPGAARNEGARATTCDVLLFLDFGNVIDPRWIEEMVRPFEADPRIDAVGGLYEPLMTNDFERCVAAIQYQEATLFARLPAEQQRARVRLADVRLGGLGMAVRRLRFLELGGQPHWLRAGEDWLFGRKLLASRAPVEVALAARLYHHMRANPGELYRQNRLYSRGEGRLGAGAGHHLRTATTYSLVAGSLLASLWWWPAAPAAMALAGGYLYRKGVARVRRVFGDEAVRGHHGLIALAVVTKDAGALMGYGRGLLERLTQPHWRQLQQRYLSG
jgi:GT2 family glycosyltransferase